MMRAEQDDSEAVSLPAVFQDQLRGSQAIGNPVKSLRNFLCAVGVLCQKFGRSGLADRNSMVDK